MMIDKFNGKHSFLSKIEAMKKAIELKFSQNTALGQKLINTGDVKLIEGNTWHDNIWGDCTCFKCEGIKGENLLGRILMQTRTKLAKQQKASE